MTTIQTNAPYRITSIDLLRGIVMIIMAIDHTRDFFHLPAMIDDPLNLNTTTPWIFFTRWITHFCAPTFVFLSGISAFISAQKKTKAEASSFLLKRGLWLMIVEMVVITFGLSFDPIYHFIVWQVIWAIGTSMVLLGLLVRLPFKVMLVIGLVLFFGHNIVDFVSNPESPVWATILGALIKTNGTFVPLGGGHFIGIFYTILPWTGVMVLGYCMGKFFARDFPVELRKKYLMLTGFSFIALFILLRFLDIYGDPVPRTPQSTSLKSFLNFISTTKYPPSLLYCFMTLGPSMLFLAFAENIKTGFAKILSVYGRVPFFYYVLHFYLLHILVVIWFYATGHNNSQIISEGSPFLFRPATNFGFGLAGMYCVWLFVVLALYFPCRWFDKYKRTHTQWWLKYL